MKKTFKKIIAFILKTESRLVLLKYKPKIIAITGSVGKTSTKDAIFAVISGVSRVRKSDKSYNSEIGLPLTILGCPNGWNNPLVWFSNILKGIWLLIYPYEYPKWLVLEVGIGKPKDMEKTALWLKTDAVVITTIGETPAHIEFFSSRKSLIEEKSKLINTLKKDGILVLNNDDSDVINMKEKTKCRITTYGFKAGSDVMASNESIFYTKEGIPEGLAYRIDEDGTSFPVIIDGVFGKNHIYASLAALGLSLGLGLNIIEAIGNLKKYNVPPGRMRLLNGIKNSFIIDDTYNSSPFACESALKTLGEIKSLGRKIAVLGDMLELGKHTDEAHKNIGHVVKENADVLIIVGQRAQNIRDGAKDAGMKGEIFEFLDSIKAGEFLKDFVQEKDLILVKGSQGMRMERVVEAVLLEQDKKNQLLVRQDEEWKNKK